MRAPHSPNITTASSRNAITINGIKANKAAGTKMEMSGGGNAPGVKLMRRGIKTLTLDQTRSIAATNL